MSTSTILLVLCLILMSCSVALSQTCDNIAADQPNVCSSHGFCIATDTCLCHHGYDPKTNCLKRNVGHAFSAGDNSKKQLGDPLKADLAYSYTMMRVGDYMGLMKLELVSAGEYFALALNTKGEVFGWGANNYGQLGRGSTSTFESIPTIIEGDLKGKRIVSIAACVYHALAADEDGKVYAWGTNSATDNFFNQLTSGWLGVSTGTLPYSYQPKLVSSATMANVIKVACGRYSSVALTSTKRIFSWGGNFNGQLGLGTTGPTTTPPTRVSKSDDQDQTVQWVDVASGENHIVSIDDKGRVWTWGSNRQRQVGIDDADTYTAPAANLVFTDIDGKPAISIGASRYTSFAVLTDGSVYAWGNNNAGELGNPTKPLNTPTGLTVKSTLLSAYSVKSIISGFSSQNVYAKTDTDLWGWGYNSNGQFGLGSTGTYTSELKKIASPYSDGSVLQLSPDYYHSIYLIESDKVCYSIFATDPLVCAGHGNCTASDTCNCQSGYAGDDCSLPICNGKNAGDQTVCSGHGQCLTVDTCLCHQGYSGVDCEIKDEGYLYGSGDNSYGQLADNLGRTEVWRLIPVQSLAFKSINVNSVASGYQYSLILLRNGTLYAVGQNDKGQLGDGSTTNRLSPITVQGPFNGQVVAMCAGIYHSLVVDSSGNVWSFGDNSNGQLGNGVQGGLSSTPIKVQGALTNEKVVAVACGNYHSIALIRNGTVLAWGYNGNGQLGDGTTVNKPLPQTVHLTGLLYKRRISTIASGGYFSMVIADDGTLYRWGRNSNNELGDGTNTDRSRPIPLNTPTFMNTVRSISATVYSSYIIADGIPYSTGYNLYGQLGLGSTTNYNSYQKITLSVKTTKISSGLCGIPSTETFIHASVITNDSIALVWGDNRKGQLGDGTLAQQNSPIKYHIYYPDRPVVSVSIGCYHTMVLYSIKRTCFGVLSDEPSVCSYHGNCTAVDQCSCEQGYTGDNCDYFECSGVARTNYAAVCSGRGKCIGVDSCVCDPGFSGSNCEKQIRGIVYAVGRHQPAYGELGNDDVPSIGYSTILLPVEGLLNRVIVTKVDGGNSFSAALDLNGNLYTWGYNNVGQLGDKTIGTKDRPVLVLSQVIDFCVGDSRATAIKHDFSVWGWGQYVTSGGALTTPTNMSGFVPGEKPKAVGCGTYHTLVLTDVGTVYAFGNGGDGALGVGSTSSSWTAVKVLGLDDIVQVSGGDRHSLAVGSFGQVFAWGKNNYGQLGDTTTTNKNVPVLVTGETTTKVVTKTSGSYESSFALTNDGEIYSWGGNRQSVLGDASIPIGAAGRTLPGLVKGLDAIVIKDIYTSKISNPWAAAINATGAGYSWGYNQYANLGDKTAVTPKKQPTAQTINENYSTTTVVSIGAASQHSLILMNGTICFGILADDPLVCSWRGQCVDENLCQCDDGYFGNECEVTQCFGVNSNDSSVCSGRGTCIALNVCSCTNQLYTGENCELAVMGYVFGTGANNVGQLGDDLTYARSVLVMTSMPLSTEKYVKFISSGNDFSLAITAEGELYSWGLNTDYTLGIGGRTNQVRPQRLLSSIKFISASAARYHAAAVDTNGTVYTWGVNTENGDTTFQHCTYYYYSTCTSWSTNYECQSETVCCPNSCYREPKKMGMLGLGSNYWYSATPRPVSGISGAVISVSCGVYHCMVLTSSGELWSWGDNTYGQLGNGAYGADTMQYSPVRVAYSKSNGGTLSNVKIVAISAGSYHSMALSSLGELYVWGSNENGQIGDGIVRSSNLCRFPKRIIKPPVYRVPFKTISAGAASSHVLTFDGSLFSWGSNSKGQLGINSTVTTAQSTPVLVNEPHFSVLSASNVGETDASSFAISADLNGHGYGWGSGTNNKLVNGVTSNSIAPSPMSKLYANPFVTQTFSNRTIVAVAAGTQHSLLLLNGTYCFGLFSDDPYVCSSRGNCVATDTCQCDSHYSGDDCGLTTCFDVSSNDSSVCSGNGFCTSHDACSCSFGYTGDDCSTYLFGETYSIGSNSDGQLGDDYYLSQTTPMRTSFPLSYGEHVKYVSAGIDFSVAISRSNKLYVWGNNSYYNLGTGSQTKSLRPVTILSTHDIVGACAGKYHGVAVNSSGAVYSWGTNTDGILACTSGTPTLCEETSCPCYTVGGNPYSPTIEGQLGLSGTYYFSKTPRQVTGIPAGEKVVSVSCGWMHTLARTQSGKLYAWGDGSNGQIGHGSTTDRSTPIQVATSSPVREILSRIKIVQHASGYYHNIALGSKGDVYTWGDNSKGQLGHGSPITLDSQHPIRVYDLNSLSIVQVAAGDYSSYALTSDGTVYAWGDNSKGQLGINETTVTYASRPKLVKGLDSIRIVSLAAGSGTVIAISSEGKAYSWGLNSNYQAIVGSNTNTFVPTEVINPEPTRKIVGAAPGNVFSIILLNTTYCYGIPRDDKMACSTRGNCTDTNTCDCHENYSGFECQFTTCYGLNNTDSNACSGHGTCVAYDTCQCYVGYSGQHCEYEVFGSLRSVGKNNYGQLGDDYTTSRTQLVKPYEPLGDGIIIRQVASGVDSSFAIIQSGDLYSWGLGSYYKLGHGVTTNQLFPKRVTLSELAISVCSGTYHSVAITSTGSVYSWGVNTLDGGTSVSSIVSGQMGIGSTTKYSASPKLISNITGTPIVVTCGERHTLVLTKEGSIYGFGDDITYGAVGYGLVQYEFVPVRVGASSPIRGLLSDVKIVSIAAGQHHSMALGSQGEVYAWGRNDKGQLGDNTTVNNRHPRRVINNLFGKHVVRIAASSTSSYAVTSDGELYSWGENTVGQLGINSQVNQLVPTLVTMVSDVETVSAGTWNKYALITTRNGTAFGFGDNVDSKIGDGTSSMRLSPSRIVNPYNSSVFITVEASSTHSMFLFNGTFCFGILSDDENVCSGRGVCVSTDDCQCEEGYLGDDCSVNTCFGLNQSHPDVCSGYGYCVARDTCACETYYAGVECEKAKFGLLQALGDNSRGQLGDDHYVSQLLPVQTAYPLSNRQYVKLVVTGGSNVSFALADDGKLYSWGQGIHASHTLAPFGTTTVGLLGDETLLQRNIPTQILSNIVHVCVGANHVAAVSENNTIYAWGIGTDDSLLYCANVSGTVTQNLPLQSQTCPCKSTNACNKARSILGNNLYYWSNTPMVVNTPTNGYKGKIVELACGAQHTLARTSDGFVYGWGINTNSQLGQTGQYGTSVDKPVLLQVDTVRGEPLNTRRVISIAAGEFFSMALTDRGKVYVWGDNSKGQIADDSTTSTNTFHARLVRGSLNTKAVTRIASGKQSAYAINEHQSLFAWGDNSNGQIGINATVAAITSPAHVQSLSNVTFVSSTKWINSVHVTLRSGRSFTWGTNPVQNTAYTNSNSTLNRYPVPTYRFVDQSRFIVSASMSTVHSLVLYNGTYCSGILSDDTSVCAFRGICIDSDHCVCSPPYEGNNCTVAQCYGKMANDPSVCSGHGNCLFTDYCDCYPGYTGAQCNSNARQFVYSTGDDSSSQLGDGFFVSQSSPIQASLLATSNINYISAGDGSSFALSLMNGAFAFGNNDFGQLGDNTTYTRYYPVEIFVDQPLFKVVACSGFTLAIDRNHHVFSWGINQYGQLGSNNTIQSFLPRNITQYFNEAEQIVDIACGTYHSLARSASGRVYSWGRNKYGELGRSTVGNYSPIPAMINGLLNIKRITKISAGDSHSLALNEDGSVYAWGANSFGQLGDGTVTHRTRPYLVQSELLFGQEPVISVEAGFTSSYALLLNGTLFSWGMDVSTGTRTRPQSISFVTEHPIVAISAGKNSSFAIALASNGTAWGWGENRDGQLGDYTFTSRNYSSAVGNTIPQRYITSVSTGRTHTLFLYSGISCFGIVFDDPTVCSWRGNCTALDHCECPPSYGGRDCSIAQCFDVNATDPNVCSGGGRCVSLDTCVCFQGFSGQRCEVASFGYLYSSGQDSYSQLGSRGVGFRPTVERSTLFDKSKINLVVPAYEYSLLKTVDGRVFSWGRNHGGQLGDNTTFSKGVSQHILEGTKIVGLCGGEMHAMALEANGTVFAWGSNRYGQIGINSPDEEQLIPTRVTGDLLHEDVVAIACGGSHSMALTFNGSIYTWGYNLHGELGDNTFVLKYTPVKVGALLKDKRIVQIAAGRYHSMALGSDGTVYSWGMNDRGQLGDNTKQNKFLPVQIPGLLYGKPVSQITAGLAFSIVMAYDGSLYSWGANQAGQLGDGTTIDRNVPTRVTILPNDVRVLTLSAGGSFVHAIGDNKEVYSWGDNYYGQLGDGNYNQTKQLTPVLVQKQFPSIYSTAAASGDNFSLYLYNGTTCYGKFADDPTVCSTKGNCVGDDHCVCNFPYNAPDCSSYHCFGLYPNNTETCSGRGTCLAADSCACLPGYIGKDCSQVVNGYAFALGRGTSGQMANGYYFDQVPPVLVTGKLLGKVISHVSSGKDFSIAISADGQVFSWGLNGNGQLGAGTNVSSSSTPVSVIGLSSYHIVTGCAGYAHAAVIDKEGRVFTWGRNYRGQLGNNDMNLADQPSPVLVTGQLLGKRAVQAVCGESHTAVLIDDGSVFAWGWNANGQLGNGDNWQQLTPTQVGVGVLDDIPLSRIASGWNHMFGIGPFGVLYAWGQNIFGQLGDNGRFDRYSPAPLLNAQFKGKTAVYVEASEQNTYVLFSDGTLFSWGGSSKGQLGDGDNSTQVSVKRTPTRITDDEVQSSISLYAGKEFAFALKPDGAAFSWGPNNVGQLGDGKLVHMAFAPVPVLNTFPIRKITHVAPGVEHVIFLYNATACFGLLVDDVNVCSERGECISDDVCLCSSPEFGAPDCSETVCNGVSNKNPLVCSGNGVCIPNNTCVCQSNYKGANCDQSSFGYLFGTGEGTSGQLATGDTKSANSITKAKASTIDRVPVRFVGAGNAFSVVLTQDNQLYTVGLNAAGQLGDGTVTNRPTPVLSSFSMVGLLASNIAVGYSFAVITATNGTVWTWGSNQQGQLGIGFVNTDQKLPVSIPSLRGILLSSCGNSHCLALNVDGLIYAWGNNDRGQLGLGTVEMTSKPSRIMGIFEIKKGSSVFAGPYHSLATTVDGVLYAWGDDSTCQLGQNTSVSLSMIPVIVRPLKSELTIQITGGEGFTCVLTSKNQVWCWGKNEKGQLGDNSTVNRCTPTLVQSLLDVKIVQISSGSASTLALSDTGIIFAWGEGLHGQLGGISQSLYPQVTGANFTQRYSEFISSGYRHSMIVYNGTTCFRVLQDDPDVCSGNGTCIDWDTCVCKPGFSGTNCEFTSCFGYNMTDTANVCTGRGECKYLNTCICDPAKWSGDRCQYINCFGYPSNNPAVCSSHGQCVGPGICNCTHGYNGNNCQFTICHGRNTNDSRVCSGKGYCVEPDTCMCNSIPLPGYTGGNCSYPVCYSRYYDRITGIETIYQAPATSVDLVLSTDKDCSGHGKCLTPSVCNCTKGYTDKYCSTPICFGLNASTPASCNYGKNGTCVAPDNCTCLTKFDAEGYCVPLTCYGKNLTTVPPSCNSHLQKGNCINIDLCVCMRGYGGLECEQNVCNGILELNKTHVCHGRGYCQLPDQCVCQLGFNGTDCQYINCYGRLDIDHYVCSGHGVCSAPNTCTCDEGYAGEQCQYPICYGKLSNDTLNVCSDHGKCTAPDFCECNYGYSGLECFYPSCFEVNTTDPEVCATHGTCYKPDKCNCTDGWVSRDCSIPLCYGIWGTNRSVCSRYGFCYEPDQCWCSEGRTGNNCELNYCFGFNETDPLACNQHGTCVAPHKCSCTPNAWTGFDCGVPICFGIPASDSENVCSGRGACLFTDTCQCVFGRTGDECELNICYGKNESDPSVCSGHGTCFSIDRCNCTYGWKGDDCSRPVCFGIPFDHGATCSGVGTCIYADTCDCSRTFGKTGIECQLSICYGINGTDSTVCSSNGTCVDVDTCACYRGKTGRECELNVCFGKNESDPVVCSGHGHCVAPDICVCQTEKGYTGSDCEIPICFNLLATDATVCSSNGTCSTPNNCTCRTGRTGEQCETNICFGITDDSSSVCTGHGQCILPDTCHCTEEYTGRQCDIPICYGIAASNHTVCSGHSSQCIAPDTCSCATGKTGDKCQYNLCFGVSEASTSVCSSHGNCTSPDVCACVPQYSGSDCSLPVCFGISAASESVCNGVGSCINPDTCACSPGYLGERCDVANCYGLFSNMSTVCSGHGTCNSPNNCQCSPGYVGEQCDVPICNEILGNDTNVCSGRGKCLSPEKCLCNSGFAGTDCEIVRSQCESSGDFILVSLPNGPSQNISLVDISCGKSMYSFVTINSSRVLFSKFSKTFYLLRSDGIFSAASSATLLRPGPQQSIEDLKSAGVYVISSYIVVVSLANEVQVHYLSLSNKNDDKICSTSQYSPIAGITDGRFSTIDADTGSVFLLAKKISNGRIVVLQSSFESSKCQFSELISFKTFPPTADLQAMAFVDKAVHFFRRTYVSKIHKDQLTLVADLSGFFASEKQESNSHVYLNDVSKRLLMIIPKNKPFDATPSIYPLDLSDKTFTIIANWEPIIGKISPIGVPADSLLTTWIRLNGQHVSLNAQSTITLVDPGIKLSVTANLVDCSTVGLEGDACFKPNFNWPTGRGSVEFTEIFVSSVPDSTPVPQPGISLVYFQPEINSIYPTTAKQDDIIKVYGHWFSTEKNVTCTFQLKRKNGEEEIIEATSSNVHQRYVECPLPLIENANNLAVQVTVTMMNREFASRNVPAFFYYLDTRALTFYDTMDQNTLLDNFDASEDDMSIEWIPFDDVTSRSLSRITTSLSNSHQRAMLKSKAAIITTPDQQFSVEFILDQPQSGNLLELWHISHHDEEYHVVAGLSVDSSSGATQLSTSYRLGQYFNSRHVVNCPSKIVELGASYTMTLKLVRPEIELINMNNETLFNEWYAAQNVSSNSSQPLPDEPWRIDVQLTRGFSQICALSFQTNGSFVETLKRTLSTAHVAISQSIPGARSIVESQNSQKDVSLTILIDRLWVSCQYASCNQTIPKKFDLTPIPEQLKQYTKGVVVAVSSIAGSLFFLLFLALLIPVALVILWRLWESKRKKTMQSKLDAWKFEFVLDKNVTSLDDDQFASVARKMYKVEDGNEAKMPSLFSRGKHTASRESRDIEMTDFSDMHDSTTSYDTNSDIELMGPPSSSAFNALRNARMTKR